MHWDDVDRDGQTRRADAAGQYHARKPARLQQRIDQHTPAFVPPLPGIAEQAFQIIQNDQDGVVIAAA
jgi:hypothetical protein